MRRMTLAALALVAAVAGCTSRAELVTLREGMDRATRTIREQQLDWATKLTVDPATGQNHAYQLPRLTPADLAAVETAQREYNALVKRSRDRDGTGTFFGGGTKPAGG